MTERATFKDSLKSTYASASNGMEVSGVLSVWAPVVQNDEVLAINEAESLAAELRVIHPEISEEEMDRLVQFGAAVGSLSLRRLFEPFVSDAIVVTYSEASERDHTDAIRRVANGANVNQSAIVG